MQLLSVDATVFSKNFQKMFWLQTHEKKCPQKLLIIGPQLFLGTDPAAQTVQKQKPRTTKSPLMQN